MDTGTTEEEKVINTADFEKAERNWCTRPLGDRSGNISESRTRGIACRT